MSEIRQVTLPEGGSRASVYPELFSQLEGLLDGETDAIAGLANCASLLYFGCRLWWVGFYRVMLPAATTIGTTDLPSSPEIHQLPDAGTLVLGPFHGPVACVRIGFGAGVCGAAWRDRRLLNVPDVDAFPGHIACSSESRSELVAPIHAGGDPARAVVAVLDLDSAVPGDFDTTDERWIERIAGLIGRRLYP